VGGTAIKGNFILKIKDSYNEESFEKLAGEMEGELKEDIENINFFLKNSQNEYSIKLENKELSLIRNSENKLNINLKFNGEKNNFFYEIENFKQNFLVLGEKYSYNIKNKSFEFSYLLLDENHNEINKIIIIVEQL